MRERCRKRKLALKINLENTAEMQVRQSGNQGPFIGAYYILRQFPTKASLIRLYCDSFCCSHSTWFSVINQCSIFFSVDHIVCNRIWNHTRTEEMQDANWPSIVRARQCWTAQLWPYSFCLPHYLFCSCWPCTLVWKIGQIRILSNRSLRMHVSRPINTIHLFTT